MSMRLENFLSEEYFDYVQEMSEQYMNLFLNHKIFLYKIDRKKTNLSKGFEEATPHDMFFHDPVEVPCVIQIQNQTNEAYSSNNSLRYEEYGNLIVHVLEKTLDERGLVFEYGDYVAYPLKKDKFIFYSIINNDYKNISNVKSFGGYLPVYKSIECTPVDQNEINFL
jgi:hypothetical protein